MIYNLDKLLDKYPLLHCSSSPDGRYNIVEGEFLVNARSSDECFELDYSICANIYSDEINTPLIKETSGKIDVSYSHINHDGTLCLAVDAEILDECVSESGFDCEKWFDDFVISYFFSYEYFKKYGICPFGERKHGANGILEYYQQKYCVDTPQKAFSLLEYTVNHRYRGHLMCPCKSGKRIKKCHCVELWMAQFHPNKMRIITDYNTIQKEERNINNEYIRQKAKRGKNAHDSIFRKEKIQFRRNYK